jgi:hypothetical protein
MSIQEVFSEVKKRSKKVTSKRGRFSIVFATSVTIALSAIGIGVAVTFAATAELSNQNTQKQTSSFVQQASATDDALEAPRPPVSVDEIKENDNVWMFSEGGASISGMVVDQNSLGVENVIVYLVDESAESEWDYTDLRFTDVDGYFEFLNLPEGSMFHIEYLASK